MQKDTIIIKGNYSHAQTPQLVSLKQYIFARGKNGKKRLLLRFENERGESCRAFKFLLRRMDAEGNVLGEDWYEKKHLEIDGGATYAFSEDIPVEERCTDFRVQVVSAAFGDYLYQVKDGGVAVVYRKDTSRRKGGRGLFRHRREQGTQKTAPRLKRKPLLGAVVGLISLAVIFLSVSVLLYAYGSGRNTFSLDGVKYEFVNVGGTVAVDIVGYDGRGEVLLPSNIEGYPVRGIRDNAFLNNAKIKRVRIEGLNVPRNAFYGCSNLKEVELSGVTGIGYGAFYGCSSLTAISSDTLSDVGDYAFAQCSSLTLVEITAGSGTMTAAGEEPSLRLGSYAFWGCTALQSVKIDRWIRYPEKIDVFYGSTGVETLQLKNFAYANEYNYGNRAKAETVASLFGAGVAPASLSLKTVSIDYIDQISYRESAEGELSYGFCEGIETLQSFKVSVSEWNYLPKNAFKGCTSLTELSLPAPLTAIGESACEGTAFPQLNAANLVTVGARAFANNAALTKINIPQKSPLKELGESAFEGCANLSAVSIPSGIQTLYPNTFRGCTALSAVMFSPDCAVTELPAGVFSGCASIKKISLPSSVQVIGAEAFADCTALEEFPATLSLRSVGEYAFRNTALSFVEIEAKVTEIGFGAFENCQKMTTISLPYLGGSAETESPYLGYVFGLSVGRASEGSAVIDHEYDEGGIPASLTSVVVRKEYEKMPDHAFYGCVGLQNFAIPATVTEMGEHVFGGCEGLQYVTLSQELTEIPARTFEGCSSLLAVALPENLTSVGASAFENCSSIRELYFASPLEFVDTCAFSGCSSLSSLTFASDVTVLGESSFENCTSLTEIVFSGIVEEVGARAFYGCGSLSRAAFANEVKTVGSSAFENCTALSAVEFPVGVKTLSARAFAGCPSLVSLTAGEIGEIGSKAFENCSSLGVLMLSVTQSVGKEAFFGCVGLQNVVFLSAFETLEEEAFASCTNLAALTFNGSVSEIKYAAFAGCSGLSGVWFSDFIGLVGERAFADCTALTDVSFGDYVNTVGVSAFEGCTSLVSLRLEGTVKTLSSRAFAKSGLVSASVGSGVQNIERGVFADCLFLRELTVPFVGSAKNVIGGASIGWLFGDSNGAVPESLETLTVGGDGVDIPAYAFADCSNLKEVVLQEGVRSVEDFAFSNCSALSFLSLPSSVTEVSADAFFGCRRLYEVENLSGVDVGDSAAYALEIRTERGERSPSVEQDGYRFSCYDGVWFLTDYDDNRTELTFPNYVLYEGSVLSWSIPREFFAGNRDLTSVALPNGTLEIGDYAFRDCYNLNAVSMGDTVMQIGEGAFLDCMALEIVKLSANLFSVGDFAFENCNRLYDVYYIGSALSITEGSAENGGVARNAIAVHRDLSESPSEELWLMNGTLLVRRAQEKMLIHSYTGREQSLLLLNVAEGVTSIRIAEWAASYNYELTELTIGPEVVFVQRNAFAYCPNLKKVTVIGGQNTVFDSGVFEECTNLRSVELAGMIPEIGDRMFAGCAKLESVQTPPALERIGAEAFMGCERLLSFTLPETLKLIGQDAFLGCESLYEVYDLTPNYNLTPGSEIGGGVATYAKKVYTSRDEGFVRLTEDGYHFLFDGEKWYLYSADFDGKTVNKIPEVGFDVEIMNGALVGDWGLPVVLPATVTKIADRAFGSYSVPARIYYCGNEEEWNSLDWTGKNSVSEVYYYESCVHEQGQWKYDENGEISTDYCLIDWKTLAESTCFTEGSCAIGCLCEGCDYLLSEPESTPKKESHLFEQGVCVYCNRPKTEVNGDNVAAFSAMGILQNDAVNPFAFDQNYGVCVKSTANGSTATLIVVAQGTMTVTFSFGVVSPSGASKMTVTAPDLTEVITSVEGESKEHTVLLNAGQAVIFLYERGEGLDEEIGFVKNLYFVMQ